MQKKVIEIKLNEYAPIRDNACTISTDHDQVYEIKFHGKPPNILPRINSKIENTSEKNKTKLIFLETNKKTNDYTNAIRDSYKNNKNIIITFSHHCERT